MITEDKVIQFFCIINEFNKNFNAELDKKSFTLPAYVIVTAKVRYTNYSRFVAFPIEHWRVKFTKTLVDIILFWRTLYIYTKYLLLIPIVLYPKEYAYLHLHLCHQTP